MTTKTVVFHYYRLRLQLTTELWGIGWMPLFFLKIFCCLASTNTQTNIHAYKPGSLCKSSFQRLLNLRQGQGYRDLVGWKVGVTPNICSQAIRTALWSIMQSGEGFHFLFVTMYSEYRKQAPCCKKHGGATRTLGATDWGEHGVLSRLCLQSGSSQKSKFVSWWQFFCGRAEWPQRTVEPCLGVHWLCASQTAWNSLRRPAVTAYSKNEL